MFGSIGPSELILLVLIALYVAFLVWVWVRIAGKAGYNRYLGLLLLIPLVNLVVVIIFAFSEWPVERRLRELEANMKQPVSATVNDRLQGPR